MDNRAAERDGSLNRRRAERRAGGKPTAAPRIRVLVVEDNRVMRDGLARLLSAYGDVAIVATAESAKAATQLLRDTKPHLVLLDADLANGDSYAFLANLKATAPDAKAVVMDFVPAQQDVHQLIDGNASHTRGAGTPAGTGAPIAGHVRLTKREQEIKELIAAGLGNKDIARRLNIATTTVKSHVHNMLGKLAALTPPDRRRSGNRSRRGTSRRSYRFTR